MDLVLDLTKRPLPIFSPMAGKTTGLNDLKISKYPSYIIMNRPKHQASGSKKSQEGQYLFSRQCVVAPQARRRDDGRSLIYTESVIPFPSSRASLDKL